MRTDLLIAEHEAVLRDAYESLFGKLGIHVVTAANGLECWTKLRDCTPDVLVLDMEMLWGGGDGVLACLREDRNGALSRAVFITGFDAPTALSRRYGIVVGNCIQKPFPPSKLLECVCAVVDAGAETAFAGQPA